MKHYMAPIMIAALAVFALSCKLEVIQDYDVDGKAVNVQASKSDTTWGSVLSGTAVTLKDTSNGDTYNATVSSFGNFGFDGLPVGEYRMTASKSGWAFVPRVVDITGSEAQLPPLLGFQPVSDSIYIITEWKNVSVDVDSTLVIDDDNATLQASLDGTELAIVGPADSSSYGSTVILDRDISPTEIAKGLPAVETIRIVSNPFGDKTGWLKFYLNAYKDGTTSSGELTGNSSASIKDAQATVHVMQGTTHLGTFPVATETQETTLMVLAIKAYLNGSNTEYAVSSPANYGNGIYLNTK